jgi:hypothetical protein
VKTSYPASAVEKLRKNWRFVFDAERTGEYLNWQNYFPQHSEEIEYFNCSPGSALWLTNHFSLNAAIYAAENQIISFRYFGSRPTKFKIWIDGKLVTSDSCWLKDVFTVIPDNLRITPESHSVHSIVVFFENSPVIINENDFDFKICGSSSSQLKDFSMTCSKSEKSLDIDLEFLREPGGISINNLKYSIVSADNSRLLLEGRQLTGDSLSVPLKNIRMWHPENKMSYLLNISEISPRKELKPLTKEFSISNLSYNHTEQIFYNNKKRITVSTLCLNSDQIHVNPAELIKSIKNAGFNTLLLNDIPAAAYFAEEAYREGLYVIVDLSTAFESDTCNLDKLKEIVEHFAPYPNLLAWHLADINSRKKCISTARTLQAFDSTACLLFNLCSRKNRPAASHTADIFDELNVRHININNPVDINIGTLSTNTSNWKIIDFSNEILSCKNQSDRITQNNFNLKLLLQTIEITGDTPLSMLNAGPDTLEVIEHLSSENSCNSPFFLKPAYSGETGLDIEYIVGYFSNASNPKTLEISLTPVKNRNPLWRTKVTFNEDRTASFTLPGRLLLPGEYLLKAGTADNDKFCQINLFIHEIPDELLSTVYISCHDLSLARGLGIGSLDGRKDLSLILTEGNSLFEHDLQNLAELMDNVQSGGTAIFLGTPYDCFSIMEKAGLVQHGLEIVNLSPPAVKYNLSCDENLFHNLPSSQDFLPVWQSLYARLAIRYHYGRSYCDIISDKQNEKYSALLEVEYGLGRLVFTSFSWLTALGRTNISEVFLARIIKYFEQSELKEVSESSKHNIFELLSEIKSEYRQWSLTGPFSQDTSSGRSSAGELLFAQSGPEKALDFNNLYYLENGRILRWKKHFTSQDNNFCLDLAPLSTPNEDSVVFAGTEVTCRSKNIGLLIDCPYPFLLYQNGSEVEEKLSGFSGRISRQNSQEKVLLLFKILVPGFSGIENSCKIKLEVSEE